MYNLGFKALNSYIDTFLKDPMRRNWIIFFVSLLALDRVLKRLALNGYDWTVDGFRFVLFRNDNAVFSLPTGPTFALIVMIIGVLVLIGVRISARRNAPALVVPSGLMLAGAVGNLYDRIVYGYVVDWAYFGPHWPIFNLADLMVATGLVWYIWQRSRLTKR